MMARDLTRRTVWVVDDSAVDAERARRALDGDHRVELFTDGSAALEHLAHGEAPDVMVLDWLMPGVSGLEVCRFVRAGGPRLRELGVLLLTARRETGQVVEGLAAGANDYVSKPFEPDELRARVDALLRAKDLRERAERAEAMAARLLARAPDPILAIDAQGVVTFVNDEARRILGDRAVGRPVHDLLPALPRDSIELEPGVPLFPLPDVRLGERTYAPALRALPPDGAAAMTIILRDVTDQRRAAARRLDFYAVMAHDLRAPLGASLLRTDLLLRGHHGYLPPKAVESVRKLDGTLKSLAAMVGDFLDLARLQGVGPELAREDVELVGLVDAVVEDLSPLVDLHRLAWRPVRPGRPVVVDGDPRRLRQVVSNLVANAIKFTPPGGTITTEVRSEDAVAEVVVADTGPGISPEALPTVFDRYARHVDASHEVAGSGLGLMIVRDLVHAHGGEVGVESAPGAGSRFWVRLPRRGGP
jgi:two-component system phosphate regulon sensor histidine kinase PhoR